MSLRRFPRADNPGEAPGDYGEDGASWLTPAVLRAHGGCGRRAVNALAEPTRGQRSAGHRLSCGRPSCPACTRYETWRGQTSMRRAARHWSFRRVTLVLCCRRTPYEDIDCAAVGRVVADMLKVAAVLKGLPFVVGYFVKVEVAFPRRGGCPGAHQPALFHIHGDVMLSAGSGAEVAAACRPESVAPGGVYVDEAPGHESLTYLAKPVMAPAQRAGKPAADPETCRRVAQALDDWHAWKRGKLFGYGGLYNGNCARYAGLGAGTAKALFDRSLSPGYEGGRFRHELRMRSLHWSSLKKWGRHWRQYRGPLPFKPPVSFYTPVRCKPAKNPAGPCAEPS